MGYSKSISKREVDSDTLRKEKLSHKQPNFIPQGTKTTKTKSKIRKKEMTKIRAEEVNQIQNRKNEKRSTKLKVGFLKR